MPRVKIFGHSLNPGPFTVKEHVIVFLMANVGYQSAYAVRDFTLPKKASIELLLQTDIVAVQRVYYNQIYNFSYQWMLVMSTQLVSSLFP